MTPTIAAERPDSADAMQLIAELEDALAPLYPPQSRHGYSVDKLLRGRVAFFVARHDGVPAGCGGVQIYEDYGELKRMYVRPQFRRLGLGRQILSRLEEHALNQGIALLRLETGIHQREAIALYEAVGFRRIAAFGDYWNDPVSAFYEKRLS